jgi:hypothetical protein
VLREQQRNVAGIRYFSGDIQDTCTKIINQTATTDIALAPLSRGDNILELHKTVTLTFFRLTDLDWTQSK